MLNSHFSRHHSIKITCLFIPYLFFIILIPIGKSAWSQGCPGGCDDGNPCTLDICSGSQCIHYSVYGRQCQDDGNPCTQDICNRNGECTHNGTAYYGHACEDDGNPCTMDICSGGQCVHNSVYGRQCMDDGNPCTQDICNYSGACVHNATAFDGHACEDDDKDCTYDICENGMCKHRGYPADFDRPEFVIFDGELITYQDLKGVPVCQGNTYVHTFEDAEGNKFTQSCDGTEIIWSYTSTDGEECVVHEAGKCRYPEAKNSSTITGTFQSFTGSIWYSLDENSNNFYAYAFYRDTCCVIPKEFCSKDGVPNTDPFEWTEPDLPIDEMSDSAVEENGCIRYPR